MTRLTVKQKRARRLKTLPRVPLETGLSGNTARILGYARVSTVEQNLSLQITALKSAGCHHIFAEKGSAASKRPQFRVMTKFAEPGDTIVFYAFSRVSRDLGKLLAFIDDMKAKRIRLISTSEPHIDPYTTNGRLLVSVTGAVDENERGRVIDRTVAGMAELKRQGKKFGRPEVINKTLAQIIKKKFKSNSARDLAKKYGVSISSIYKCTKLPNQPQA